MDGAAGEQILFVEVIFFKDCWIESVQLRRLRQGMAQVDAIRSSDYQRGCPDNPHVAIVYCPCMFPISGLDTLTEDDIQVLIAFADQSVRLLRKLVISRQEMDSFRELALKGREQIE